jgi:nitrate/TMAO reductase-like tetraheme cytochrome c subunit
MGSGRSRLAVVTIIVLVIGVLAFIGIALATDRSAFCDSCHEMTPYYAAWTTGQHSGHAECIDCHVDQGLPARFAHKFVALKEVWSHFSGDTKFPRPTAPKIPDARCQRCHPALAATIDGFPHAVHAEKGRCAQCHTTTGHSVTSDALKSAGVLDPTVAREQLGGPLARVGAGKANLPGHPVVRCSDCHDMAATPCSSCHKHPKDEHPDTKAQCSTCHRPAARFVFTHPADPGDCAKCHEPPTKRHPNANGTCNSCHPRPGAKWTFSHPGAGVDCRPCHKRPGGRHPTTGTCTSCHRRVGSSWSFNHPSAGEHSWRKKPCAKCHPQSYDRVYCTCHKGRPPNDD